MYRAVRSFLFRLDAESAHDFTAAQMRRLQEVPLALSAVRALCAPRRPEPVELFGLRFPNRFGIAAGFDKNGELIPILAALF